MNVLRKTLILLTTLLVLATSSVVATAQDNDVEIEYLLTTVGSSNCVFIRNGTRHSAANAESHLRMKYGKTRGHIDNADEFIIKLASESSWTGKPYTLDCPGEEQQPSETWLFEKLEDYRTTN